MAIITISRLEACRGEEVAAAVARRLGFRLVDHRLELYAVPLDDDSKA